MIIYQSNKERFIKDLISNEIHEIIEATYKLKTGHRVAKNELRSWQESMRFMGAVMDDEEIPNDAGVSIEYSIPQTSKRIDFILTGQDQANNDQVVIIELKQWESAELTDKDAIVKTRFQHGLTETSHPSYQAWSYSELLNQLNETVYTDNIHLAPCAYLHNYIEDDVIKNNFYQSYIERAPVFLKGKDEKEKLKTFIKSFVKYGDKSNLMFRIENGKIKPSKSLADSLAKMIAGNPEFIMLDEQKLVYETAIKLAKESSPTNKNVLIVQGGPGTGKSVVAVNLLVNIIQQLRLVAQYITKNAAPRAVYEAKLTGSMRKSAISNLFTGSGSFHSLEPNAFDVLVVDEAHRLNEKSGMFKNIGENQVKEIIKSSKLAIFFIDEDQQVTFSDIGSKEEIEKWANLENATVHHMALESQFRCNGSDGYLAWLDDVLGIRETANKTLDGLEYDFQVLSNPNDLKELIFNKNKINNKARIVAGYCWNWISRADKSAFDISIPNYDFGMQWNLDADGSLWIQAPDSVSEVGCIHTCQGLEVDYVGVIIGDDLIVRNGEVITNPNARAKTDKSISGFKKLLKTNPDLANKKADGIIRNTYRTLMTRGMKGCYVFCTDPETQAYFQARLRAKN
ncbi:DUF2075 domain-containing protein [Polynucleobacter wuianus]|jgi:DUF2075 family protein/DNA replication protein DnaC|uniref:DUF2075 domain-containing protein n=1 Tax=Polynucleobacter wuianus TaxID=1743168 RepID=UPI001C0B79FF|nr:DUF2075 domain-containing protein [Polynucleobacter wuianus]MBU3611127.1 DUF2075 domain-containing protein [Polynucleobacter wuianus]